MFSEHQLKSMDACGEVIKQSRRMSMTAPVDDDFPEVKHDFDSAVLTYAALLRPTPAPVKVAEGRETAWLSQDDARLALFQAIEAITIGNKTDDKLILAKLREQGIWLALWKE